MLDHVLRSVSFIADIGDVLVLMARQLPDEQANPEVMKPSQILASVGTAQTDHKNIKITCHVFQSPEVSCRSFVLGSKVLEGKFSGSKRHIKKRETLAVQSSPLLLVYCKHEIRLGHFMTSLSIRKKPSMYCHAGIANGLIDIRSSLVTASEIRQRSHILLYLTVFNTSNFL